MLISHASFDVDSYLAWVLGRLHTYFYAVKLFIIFFDQIQRANATKHIVERHLKPISLLNELCLEGDRPILRIVYQCLLAQSA